VARRIKQLDEGSVLVLNFFKGVGLLELGICQASLDVELGFNGLITNDKFCLTRWGRLNLKANRQP
jgi:hypothetical protein